MDAKAKVTFTVDLDDANRIVQALVEKGLRLAEEKDPRAEIWLALAAQFDKNAPQIMKQGDLVDEAEKAARLEAVHRVDPEEGLGQDAVDEVDDVDAEMEGDAQAAEVEADGIGLPPDEDLQTIPAEDADDILAGLAGADGEIDFGQED